MFTVWVLMITANRSFRKNRLSQWQSLSTQANGRANREVLVSYVKKINVFKFNFFIILAVNWPFETLVIVFILFFFNQQDN